jgi:hypothetical protein
MDPLEPDDPIQVGGYRLVGRLGASSMGLVFLGRSAAGGQVAVRLIRPEHAQTPRFRFWFVRDVHAALRVSGFHTAQVLAADPNADIPWMVTAYIPGPSLDDVVTERGPLPLDQVRALGAGLAEGLAAIHACDLVHRDLKPSNIIMANDGPRIIDFGIGSPLGATAMTQTGAVAGTRPYMSPEQVHGAQVGTAGDVFSLGCVLAFAATGHSPFYAGTIPAIMNRIANADPDLTGLPKQHELRDLITACLAKNSAGRPELAEILAQLTEPATVVHKPIRQPAAADDALDAVAKQAPRWLTADHLRSQPAGDHGYAEDTAVDRDRQQRQRPESVTMRSPVRRRIILLAGLGAVATIPAIAIASRLSNHPAHRVLTGDVGAVDSVAFSPDGKTLASGSVEGKAQLWDLVTGHSTTLNESDSVESVVFSPDGKTLASGSGEGIVRLWDVTSGTSITTLKGHVAAVESVVFSPDGKTLATGSDDKTVWLWNVASRLSADALFHASAVQSVVFSPDGKTLATGSDDKTVWLWDMASRTSIAILAGHAGAVQSVAFSPDGKILASGSDDTTVRLWKIH